MKKSVEAQLSKKYVAYVKDNPDFYPDAEGFLAALDAWPEKAVRANTHVSNITDLTKAWEIDFDPVTWCLDATYFEFSKKIGSTKEHQDGFCYVGDPSAMLAIECIQIKQDDFVVDMCAAPGGKSVHALNSLGPSGTLVANDVDSRRVKILKENLDRILSAIPVKQRPSVEVTNLSAADLADKYSDLANVVILDAPCSGEAMMRRSNTARRQWSEKLMAKMATLQKMLLMHAKTITKLDGQIVYSTCTFNPQENEGVVEFGAENLGLIPASGVELLAMLSSKNTSRGSDLFVPAIERENGIAIYPHLGRGDGQFAAVLKV